MDLIERIIAYQKKAGLTYENMARELHITMNTYRRWIKGEKISPMGRVMMENFLKTKRKVVEKEDAGV